MNKKINIIKKQIGVFHKANKMNEISALIEEKNNFDQEKGKLEEIASEKEKILFKTLATVGNIVHESCIDSMDEKDNAVLRMWWPDGRDEDTERGESLLRTNGKSLMSHHEVLEKIGGYDQIRGTNVAGHRGYFLVGCGVDLNLAMIRYGLDFLENKNYTKLWTPFFMRKEMMAKTAQLEEFDEALYKVVGETSI